MDVEPEIEEGANTYKSTPIPDFDPLFSISIHKGPISCVKYSPNGKLLAISSTDKTISLYDTSTKTCKFVFEGHDKGINTISWSPDSRYLASCSDDKTIRIWNCEKGNFVRIIDKFSHFPTCIAYNPRGTVIACSCDDNHIYFFSVYTRTMVKSIYAHSNTISSLEFDKTGHRLLSASVDGYCRIWECDSGNCLQSIRLSQESIPIVCASFSPNDRYVILSCTENTLCLWCLEHNAIERVFKGKHQIAKHLCSCSFYVYQKQYIVTGSEDGCICLYDLHSDQVKRIQCTNDIIFTVSVSPTGEIAGGSMGDQNTVFIYKPKYTCLISKQFSYCRFLQISFNLGNFIFRSNL